MNMDMNTINAKYNVSDEMSLHGSYTQYGDEGFQLAGSNMGVGDASWLTHGNMGYLNPNDNDVAIGGSFAMGDFTISGTLHTVKNDEEGSAYDDGEEYNRTAMDLSLAYAMSDNANLSLNYANDKGYDSSDSENKYMWVTLTIQP